MTDSTTPLGTDRNVNAFDEADRRAAQRQPTEDNPAIAVNLRMPPEQGGTVPAAIILGHDGPGVLITVPDLASGGGLRYTFDVVAAGFDQDGVGIGSALLVADFLELASQGIRQAADRATRWGGA